MKEVFDRMWSYRKDVYVHTLKGLVHLVRNVAILDNTPIYNEKQIEFLHRVIEEADDKIDMMIFKFGDANGKQKIIRK
jgi:hypothetical protein